MAMFPDTPEFQALKNQFVEACEEESRVLAAVLTLADMPGPSLEKRAAVAQAADDMEASHLRKMQIWYKLLELRIAGT